MLVWVYQQAKKARKLDEVYVATDDERIEQMCREHRIPVVMTSSSHPTGANRLQEVSETIPADFYIQLNGDEPLLDPDLADAAVPDTVDLDEAFGTNIITKMHSPSEVMDPANIKVVFDEKFRALYMSRTPIPYPFKSIEFEYYPQGASEKDGRILWKRREHWICGRCNDKYAEDRVSRQG